MHRPSVIPATLILAWSIACTCQGDPQLMADFREAKSAALADPGPAPKDWRPDAALHLSPSLVDRLVQSGLEGAGPFQGKVDVGGGVVLKPDMVLDGLELAASKGCDACLEATVHLAGDLDYRAGILGKGSVPLRVDATLDVVLESKGKAKSWVVTARADKVRKLSIDLVGMPKAISKLAEEPVRSWAEDELKGLEPLTVTELKHADLPVRDLRVGPEGAGLRIDLLTGAVKPGTVASTPPKLTDDWQLDIATQSLVWLARTAAFEAGPQTAAEIVAVPEALSVKRDTFTLDLRLWRTAEPGWWRDYEAVGKVAVVDGNAVLKPDKAEQKGSSPGAGWADPLALLAEGLIVDTIETAMDQSLPAAGSATVEGWVADVDVVRVLGAADGTAIQVQGTLGLKKAH